MPYEIKPNVWDINDDGTHSVRTAEPGEEPEFYSVFIRFTDQCAHWRADFVEGEDAQEFVERKTK